MAEAIHTAYSHNFYSPQKIHSKLYILIKGSMRSVLNKLKSILSGSRLVFASTEKRDDNF